MTPRCILIAIGASLIASSAAAQPASTSQWVVLPVIVEGETGSDFDALAFAEELELEMTSEIGVSVTAGALAATTFETVHSADPESGNAIEQWSAAVDRARRVMATRRSGRFREALAALHDVSAATDLAIAALGREEAGARSFLDACFLEATVHLERGRRAQAREVLMACRRQMSHVEPHSESGTPDVRELLEEIDRELVAAPHATLRVESAGDVPCTVRVTGVALGQTPTTFTDLPQHVISIQVECGDRPGRVHRVDLRGDTTLRVDTVSEAAIRSRPASGPPRLYLTYATRADAQRYAERDAALIESALGAAVVVVMPHDDARLRLVRVSRTLGPAHYVAVRDRTAALMRRCAVQMTEEPQPQVVAAAESELEAAANPPAPPADVAAPALHLRASDPLAIGFLSAGAAAFVIGSTVHVVRGARGDTMLATPATSADYLANQDRYLRLRPVVLGASVAGGALAAVGAAHWVRRSHHRRTLAWVGGGLGLGFATWAAVDGLTAPACIQRPFCVRHDEHVDRAILAASLAAPALSMPLAAAFPRAEVTAAASVGPSFAFVELRGSLR